MRAAAEDIVTWAQNRAARYLDRSPFLDARWPHVQAVAEKAMRLAPAYGTDGDVLVAAAWLHDIGYAPELAETGFHPLDGARYVAGLGADRLAALVCHPSRAAVRAPVRGPDSGLA